VSEQIPHRRFSDFAAPCARCARRNASVGATRGHAPAQTTLSVAAKKGTNLAGEKEPVVGLRSGLRRAQKWGSGDCFLLSSRIVHPFGQRGAISLAGDLENDRPFDQPIEESHRQRAIGHVVSPFVEVDVGHQGGGALLVA